MPDCDGKGESVGMWQHQLSTASQRGTAQLTDLHPRVRDLSVSQLSWKHRPHPSHLIYLRERFRDCQEIIEGDLAALRSSIEIGGNRIITLLYVLVGLRRRVVLTAD